MVVSILHRATGIALTFGGLIVLTWWLMAIAGDANGFAAFGKAAHHPVGTIILIGLTWSCFEHLLSGARDGICLIRGISPLRGKTDRDVDRFHAIEPVAQELFR